MTWMPFRDEIELGSRSGPWQPSRFEVVVAWRPAQLAPGNPDAVTVLEQADRWNLAPERYRTEDECALRCDELNAGSPALASERQSHEEGQGA